MSEKTTENYINPSYVAGSDESIHDSAYEVTEVTTGVSSISDITSQFSEEVLSESGVSELKKSEKGSGSDEDEANSEEMDEVPPMLPGIGAFLTANAMAKSVNNDSQDLEKGDVAKEKAEEAKAEKAKADEAKKAKDKKKKPSLMTRFKANLAEKKKKYSQLSFYRNNLSYFITILLYILIQVFFVLLQLLVLYPNLNVWLNFARAAGILLNFNTVIVVLLVLRRLNTFMRNSTIGRKYLVLDESLSFHKFIGFFILFLGWFHAFFHFINLWYLSDNYYWSLGKTKDSRAYIARFISTFKFSIYNASEPIEFTYDLSREIENQFNNLTFRDDINSTITTTPWPGLGNYGALLFWTNSRFGWVGYSAAPTGWLLLLVLSIMAFFALPFIRSKGYFQLFYFTHWLHIAFYILLILHAKNYWKWFIGPAVIYIVERFYTFARLNSKYGETHIKDVNLLSSKVTNLVIQRPPDFKFKSGDYIFVNIPKIAKYEWHPFTISSAPEMQDVLNLHIRSLGNWTNKLHEYFTNISNYNKMFEGRDLKPRTKPTQGRQRNRTRPEEPKYETKRKMSTLVVLTDFKKNDEENITSISEEKVSGKRLESHQIEVNLNISNKIENIWTNISVDGPYGTASRGIFYSEHAVLIAGGIGVTPFASILQSLWFKYSNALKTCSNCNNQWYDKFEEKTLKKVDFIWVNRDYQAFEWFIELLGELELQQLKLEKEMVQKQDRFLNIHLYMTSSKVEREIMLDASQLGVLNKYKEQSLMDESSIKGFSMKLKPGRPPLEKIFTEIEKEKKGKVDVFFCGNVQFGNLVQKNCLAKKFKFSKEIF